MPRARTLAASLLSPLTTRIGVVAGGADLAGHGEAVGAGHGQVEQHDVGRFLAHAPDGGQAVVGGDDLVPLGAHEGGDGADHGRVVIDDEDPQGAAHGRHLE